jgi:peptidoglycan/xylan/chitin deacetylase (PgdA/CDA1 family)
MYHRIDPKRSASAMTRALTVSPAAFESQMRWLRGAGYHAVSLQQLFSALEYGTRLPARPVVITFDDGYRDVLWYAAPVLHRLGMPATMYVITGRVSGPDPSFLTWGQLRTLERLGVAIGSHTVNHAEVTRLAAQAAMSELVVSKKMLEQHLGHGVYWFSYPAGRFDQNAEALVRDAGYVLAVTTQPGVAQQASQPFALRRVRVLNGASLQALLGP